VIVRIAGQGQYQVPAELVERLNELDNEAVAAVEAGDDARFHELFGQMVNLVQNDCEPLPDHEIAVSDVILPPPDLTFEEARAEFTGEGLIPD
jgi:PspAA-like protein